MILSTSHWRAMAPSAELAGTGALQETRQANQGLGVAAAVFVQLASQVAATFVAGLRIHDFQKGLLGKGAVTDGEVGVVEMRCNGREDLLQRPGAVHVRVIVTCQGHLLKAGQPSRYAGQGAGQIGKLLGQFHATEAPRTAHGRRRRALRCPGPR